MAHDTPTPIGGHARHDAYVPLECSDARAGGTRRVLSGKTRSVGAGGLEILLPEFLPPGTPLIIRILEGDPVHGYVAWADQGRAKEPGTPIPHGVTFQQPVDPDVVLQWLYRAERQSSARAPVEFRVEVHHEGEAGQGTCLNLSRGGMFIATDQHPSPGSEVSLFFTLPGMSHRFSILARVVWIHGKEKRLNRPLGMGVQFLDPKPAESTLIGSVVDRICENLPTV